MTKPDFHQMGMTLIELLVATVLLAVFGVMAYRGLQSVQTAQSHLSEHTDAWQRIVRTLDQIEVDVRQAILPTAPTGRATVAGALSGQNNAKWPRALLEVERSGRQDIVPVRAIYRVEEQQLKIALQPITASNQPQPDDFFTLVPGVRKLEIQFFDQRKRWHDAWPIQGIPPQQLVAVRISLVLNDGREISRLIDRP